MEQRHLLSPGQAGRGVTERSCSFTRESLSDLLSSRRPGRRTSPSLQPLRGDADLNPGMTPLAAPRPAAVLVGLVEREEGFTVLLTRRTEHLAHHAGQVSFPGGRIEDRDGTPAQAALRETEEEIGLHRSHIDLIGRLDDYVTGTGFIVTPLVGLIRPPFDIEPDPFEVAEIFEVPLSFLLDPNNHQTCEKVIRGAELRYFAMPYGRHFIWGATAGILMNLYEVLHQTRGY
ncbi:MAG: CoA pyrophosphatase [Alphaproteobacteria bacterium]|nr:CoA pyrophosphatase [Alphaproteobacteria bacterium]